MKIAEIARVAYEVNRALCLAHGDTSQPVWESAAQWQKDSLEAGINFLANSPKADAEATHAAWVIHKEADGWKFGPVRNPGLKEHPNLAPFQALLPHERAKDFVFVGLVRALLAG